MCVYETNATALQQHACSRTTVPWLHVGKYHDLCLRTVRSIIIFCFIEIINYSNAFNIYIFKESSVQGKNDDNVVWGRGLDLPSLPTLRERIARQRCLGHSGLPAKRDTSFAEESG